MLHLITLLHCYNATVRLWHVHCVTVIHRLHSGLDSPMSHDRSAMFALIDRLTRSQLVGMEKMDPNLLLQSTEVDWSPDFDDPAHLKPSNTYWTYVNVFSTVAPKMENAQLVCKASVREIEQAPRADCHRIEMCHVLLLTFCQAWL